MFEGFPNLCDHGRVKYGAPMLKCPEKDCAQQFVSHNGLWRHKMTIHQNNFIKSPEPEKETVYLRFSLDWELANRPK